MQSEYDLCEPLLHTRYFKEPEDVPGEPNGIPNWAATEGEIVMIHNFPPHVVSRAPDWGWTIQNQNIEFQSFGARGAREPPQQQVQQARRIDAMVIELQRR